MSGKSQSQQGFDVALKNRFRLRTDVFLVDFSFRVDDKSRGDTANTPVIIEEIVVYHGIGVIDAVAADKRPDHGFTVTAAGDTQKLQPLRSVLRIQLYEIRYVLYGRVYAYHCCKCHCSNPFPWRVERPSHVSGRMDT